MDTSRYKVGLDRQCRYMYHVSDSTERRAEDNIIAIDARLFSVDVLRGVIEKKEVHVEDESGLHVAIFILSRNFVRTTAPKKKLSPTAFCICEFLRIEIK